MCARRVGTRVEETARQFAEIEKVVRQIIPPDELETLVDNIGFPVSGINMTYNNTGTIGSQDGEIQIGLNEDHRPTAHYVRTLREELPAQIPRHDFLVPAGRHHQPDLEFRRAGADRSADPRAASRPRITPTRKICCAGCGTFPVWSTPASSSRSASRALTSTSTAPARNMSASPRRDVTNSMVVNLAGSSQVQPTFWLNPDNGVNYSIVMQTPQYQVDSLNALQNLPITAPGAPPQVLGAIADVKRTAVPAVYSQYNIQPLIQIYATTQGRDLGAVAADVQKIVDETAKEAPKTADVVMLGQVKTMNSSFSGLIFGLAAAIVLIYLLIVVNFQSWADPFVIITALPAALAGIVWMLFATGTTLSVPALTGAIMCMGVATANSVLVISFAKERLEEHGDAVAAAIEAGFVRLRPVLMTALAMIIGMLPMALGLGEGGEQNAPLGRAVVGGLCFATVATLIFVPVVFSIIHQRRGSVGAARGRRTACRLIPPAHPRRVAARALYRRHFGVDRRRRHRRLRHHDAQSGRRQAAGMDRGAGDPGRCAWRRPDTRGKTTTFSLPGRLEAYTQAQMYARVSGYVKKWEADIGTPVKAGELLAEIDAPDLDQQIMQAEANLASAKANSVLSDATLKRGQV